jgi:hypothetical protein
MSTRYKPPINTFILILGFSPPFKVIYENITSEDLVLELKENKRQISFAKSTAIPLNIFEYTYDLYCQNNTMGYIGAQNNLKKLISFMSHFHIYQKPQYYSSYPNWSRGMIISPKYTNRMKRIPPVSNWQLDEMYRKRLCCEDDEKMNV